MALPANSFSGGPSGQDRGRFALVRNARCLIWSDADVMSGNLYFDFYGVTVLVTFDEDEVGRRVENDFSHFSVSEIVGTPTLRLRTRCVEPDYESLPPLKAQVYSPRNICYPDGERTYIDYFGNALAIYDRSKFEIEIASPDIHLLHEIVFLSMISRVNEKLEDLGMHRVHALAVESGGQAALFMMPSGGGKTTLAMEFLERVEHYRILSEDSPIIDRDGRVLPYPLRFGIVGEKPEAIQEEHLTFMKRMEFEPKYLISLGAFEGSIANTPATPQFLFIGDRTLGPDCRIAPVGFATAMKSLMRHMVVGVGLYQGVEFLLQSSLADLVEGSGRFLSRFRRAVTLARNAEVFALELGRQPGRNIATVIHFLESRGFAKPNPSAPRSPDSTRREDA